MNFARNYSLILYIPIFFHIDYVRRSPVLEFIDFRENDRIYPKIPAQELQNL